MDEKSKSWNIGVLTIMQSQITNAGILDLLACEEAES